MRSSYRFLLAARCHSSFHSNNRAYRPVRLQIWPLGQTSDPFPLHKIPRGHAEFQLFSQTLPEAGVVAVILTDFFLCPTKRDPRCVRSAIAVEPLSESCTNQEIWQAYKGQDSFHCCLTDIPTNYSSNIHKIKTYSQYGIHLVEFSTLKSATS